MQNPTFSGKKLVGCTGTGMQWAIGTDTGIDWQWTTGTGTGQSGTITTTSSSPVLTYFLHHKSRIHALIV